MTRRDWATAAVVVLLVAVGVGAFGIPYNWCAVCHSQFPDWVCWLQGCG